MCFNLTSTLAMVVIIFFFFSSYILKVFFFFFQLLIEVYLVERNHGIAQAMDE